ncbi:MAG TPA: serine hydrolase [Vicinamibacterales bacterium]|nr:serine hydrolase [Vicinamibacterales bacterium]
MPRTARQQHRLGTVATLLAIVCLTCPVAGQEHRGSPGLHPVALDEYQGEYEYHGGTTLQIVAARGILWAVIEDAKYPLRPGGTDRFVNNRGDTIPFRRDAQERVSGFEEHGVFFRRLSARIDPTAQAIVAAEARPAGPDGRAAPYVYATPLDLSDGLAVGAARDAGFNDAAISRLVNRVIDGTYPDVHAMLVYRRGRLVLEEYFYGFDRDRPHQMRSLTKSVVSALVGIGIDRGLLDGDRELVLKRLPYKSYAHPDPRKDRLTLRDLLTMRSGLACNDWDDRSPGHENNVYRSDDWVKFVLDLPVAADSGTIGRYCSGNVLVAGRILERAAGRSLPDFAQEHLFGPLGFRNVQWNFTLSSSNSTFATLYLRPRDMLKIGVVFLQHGRWAGRQLISRAWVERSTANWTTIGDQGYGYYWWHQYANAQLPSGPRRVDMIVATGNGGQKIYIVPSLDLIVVMTGGNYNGNSPAMGIMAGEILPALLQESPAPR